MQVQQGLNQRTPLKNKKVINSSTLNKIKIISGSSITGTKVQMDIERKEVKRKTRIIKILILSTKN